MERLNREDLRAIGKLHQRVGQCMSVLVAPDHTGFDNYHGCVAGPEGHDGNHNSSGGYVWAGDFTVQYDPHAGGGRRG